MSLNVSREENLLGSVYWKFNENFFISLNGKVLNFTKDGQIEIILGTLEENSAKNLIKLFTSESIDSATNSPNDPLRSLVESLIRLGQSQIGVEKRSDEGTCYDIYFQSSVVIGGKREYPLYIIKNENSEIDELLEKLKSLKSFDEKSNVLHEFYSLKCPENDSIEKEIFTNENVYESLYEPVENVEKMMKSLKADGLKLSDLSAEKNGYEAVDMKNLQIIFYELISTKFPSEKLSKLVKFHSSLTHKQESNADVLLPLLTFALINLERGHDVGGQLKFIERFAHPINLNGINNYILTSTVTRRRF